MKDTAMTSANRRFKSLCALMLLAISSCGPAAMHAGTDTVGVNQYPNGGMYRVASALSSQSVTGPVIGYDPNIGRKTSSCGALYSATSDLTQSVHYAFFVSSNSTWVMYKVRLDDGGASPVVVSMSAPISNLYSGTSLVADTRSPDVKKHYAYGLSGGDQIYQFQLFPDTSNLDEAPVLGKTIDLAPTARSNLVVNLTDGFLYYANGTKLVSIDINDSNHTPTVSALSLPDSKWSQLLYVNNNPAQDGSKYLLITSNGTLTSFHLGANGSVKNGASLTSSNITGLFAFMNPTATDGTYYYSICVPNGFSKINVRTLGDNPARWNITNMLPSRLPISATSFHMFSTTVFDADAGKYLSGYDLHNPGTVNMVYAGAGDVAPVEKGLLYLIRGTWIGNEWPKPPGYPGGPSVLTPINKSGSDPKLGEVYLKSSVIDVKQGYAYFGHDNGSDQPNFSARVTKVQYSNKGSIKGDKITIPAGSSLSSVSLYSHTATPKYVDPVSGQTISSGNVRLAIYGDDGGNPSHPARLIWDSGDIANSVTNGWITVSRGGTPDLSTLVFGGTYWLAWQVDSTKDVPSYTQGSPNTGFITWQPYGEFPKTFTAAEDGTHKPSSLFALTPPTQAYTNPPAPLSSPVYDQYTSNQDPNNPSVASVTCYDGESSRLGGSIAHYRAELTSDNWSIYVAYRTQQQNHSPVIHSAARANPAAVTMAGGTMVHVIASDPDGDALSYVWSQVSGPGVVIFAASNAADSGVTFSAAGSYTLRVTVNDGKGGAATSDVTVTVNPAPVAQPS